MGKHIIQFSGGLGSYAAARLIVDKHGAENTVLLFADTLIEDEDLYRFLDEAHKDLGCELVRIADGRDPWQIFRDERFLGNSRVDPCSKILKRELLRRHMDTHFNPATDLTYIGIDWTEEHRFEKAKARWLPWTVLAPLCDPASGSKAQWKQFLEGRGIKLPRLYGLGFPHNNCGGFCVKAGQAHFKNLLDKFPERYAYHEQKEQELREYLGKDVAILKDRTGGNKKGRPLTLREFRERVQSTGAYDKHEWGGCGCAL